MKTSKTSLAILTSLLLPVVAAQESATVETSKQEAEAATEREKGIREEERVKALLQKKPVKIGGFLADAAGAEKKSRFFSLRQPRDARNDYKNISFDERSGRPKGFVLLRIEF